jgi:hypothetical protein
MKRQSISLKRNNNSPPVFLTKGVESTRRRGDNGEDILQLTEGDTKITIDMTDIEKRLLQLREHVDEFIIDLSDDNRANHDYIRTARRALGVTAVSHIDEIITRIFKDVTVVMPGTVGAYYIGCFIDSTSFTGTVGCSAHCAGSISPSENTMGWEACKYTCFIYTPQNFISLNETSDITQSYIFIRDTIDFKGFTDGEIKNLKNFGVQKAKLVKYVNSAKYTDMTSGFVDLENLPHVKVEKPVTREIPSSSSSSYSMFIILLLIIVLAFLWLGMRRKMNY